ncbi:class I SAM-dependent methyltransferase [Streptomyces xiaopingdaonensis]|uniref:class I SAM-dependent methyltransferase n=1 Tax=Streptomyces xiaopingdaonensis TaxID=1565415 RepID=UPI00037C460A|nr:class I SAM-dependent methyltransferase [Streptomyces xiaopingdaonensis]
MSTRPSNAARSHQAVRLLDVQPTDRVVELGCGPGVAVAALAARATQGLVVGVDHSAVMIGQARRRNHAAVRADRVRLLRTPVEQLSLDEGVFDAALAINTVGMWPDPPVRLRHVARLLRPGGRIALIGQPRRPGADAADSESVGRTLADLLSEVGIEHVRTEMLALDPPAAWVLGRTPRDLAEGD